MPGYTLSQTNGRAATLAEYLRRFESVKPLAAEAALERGDQTAAQRLLAIFAPPGEQLAGALARLPLS